MVGAKGFEPPTLWSQTRCATRLRYAPNYIRLSSKLSLNLHSLFNNKFYKIKLQNLIFNIFTKKEHKVNDEKNIFTNFTAINFIYFRH